MMEFHVRYISGEMEVNARHCRQEWGPSQDRLEGGGGVHVLPTVSVRPLATRPREGVHCFRRAIHHR